MNDFYQVIGLGRNETILTVKRRYRAQVVGKLAALAVPTPELRRIWTETKGNPEVVLGPIREALNASGYTDIFLLPAQTQIVHLEKVGRFEQMDETRTDSVVDYLANELQSIIRLTRGYLVSKSKEDERSLTSKLTEVELLTWRR